MAEQDEEQRIRIVELEHVKGYEFRVNFGPDIPSFIADEPPPLGAGVGPDAARLLAAAVANCLSASLLFCLSKSRVEVTGLRASASAIIERTETKRFRVRKIETQITVESPEANERLQRCLGLFEDFCVVTASIRQGIPVDVEVRTPAGPLMRIAS